MEKLITIVGLIFLVNSPSYSQLWKQYSDSAKVFNDQKRADKAIEYYIKAKEELRKDSLWTNTYARICNSLAISFTDMKQYEKAEPLFIEAKNIKEKVLGKEDPEYAGICNNLANSYQHMAQYEKALFLYLEARQIWGKVLGKEHPAYAGSCNNLASLYKDMGQYEKAEPLYLEAKQIREKVFGKEHPVYASSCNNLAVLYRNMGQYEKAELLYEEAKNIREKTLGKEHRDYAAICNNLANVDEDMGQFKKAELLYAEAREIWGRVLGKEHPDYAQSCNNLGVLYMHIGQYEKATSFLIEALHIREKVLGREHPDYSESCSNLASLYLHIGQYEKAEPLYVEAKNIREKVLGKEHPDYASGCNDLAGLYMYMGQYEKAESLYEEAKSIREKVLGKEHPDFAESCNNLANLYEELGQYQKAEPLYIESKNIIEKTLGKEHPAYADNCHSLAGLYSDIGQYEKAEPFYVEAKNIRERALGKEHPDYASSCNDLAVLYSEMGQYEKAEPLYVEAKNIREKALGKEHPLYALICENLAIIYNEMGQYKKAEPLYIETRNIREKVLGKEHPDYASTCSNLANLYRNMAQYEKAEVFYFEALQLRRAQVQKIFQFTSEAEKQSYLRLNKTDNNDFFSFSYAEHSGNLQAFTYDVSLSTRNLILSSMQQLRNAIYNTSDTSIKNKYKNWISSRQQISSAYSSTVTDRPASIKELEVKSDSLEKELIRFSSSFKSQQKQNNVTWQTIQKSLRPNEAAIEFIEFNFYTGKRWTDSVCNIALVLRKDKPTPELVQLFEKKQLDTLLNSFRGATTPNGINTLYSGNPALYNLTWKPLEEYLKGISKIYFASAGKLFKISFAALPVNDKQVLSDKYQLIQLNTTAALTENDESLITSPDKIQLYGGILYDADSATLKQAASTYLSTIANSRSLPDDLTRGTGFQYLPGTRHEAEEIKTEAGNTGLSVSILSGVNATEESVKALTGKASPEVLHIATHGFFFPDPKENKTGDQQTKFEVTGKAFKQSDNPLFRSGLVFAGANNAWQGKPIEGIEDGILTAYEVSNMYLPNTKLVVLSACETALGDIQGSEGVYGLQRAFKMAGVQNLVMSLWKVPDNETAEFMQLFYKNLFAKQSISNAFYSAQQTMKNKYRAEPYKWAAWVLIR